MVVALVMSALWSGCVERVYVVREPVSAGQEEMVDTVVSVTVDGDEPLAAFGGSWSYAEASAREVPRAPTYLDVITRVCSMPRDRRVIDLARDQGLAVTSVAWEDAGRASGSSVGPNISDVTLEVYEDATDRRRQPHLLPVIRHPNFRDVTADVPADRFAIRVGNAGSPRTLRTVPLAQVIASLSGYLSDRMSVFSERDDFSDPRDTHYLVSAQFVFVPLTESGVATFTPHIFNYASRPGRPAVLTLVATREGTSITVVENTRDRTAWGQTLYFNASGTNALYTAERRSSVVARVESGELDLAADPSLLDQNADVMLIVQVPVRAVRRPPPPRIRPPAGDRSLDDLLSGSMSGGGGAGGSGSSGSSGGGSSARSDVEAVVVGHAEIGGRFLELQHRDIERDPRFPIRVTVQFYRATSNGIISEADITAARATIDRVYADGDYVGSLVVDPTWRPTERH
jgi:uncharacterized membrane protein YgcG